jgi:hypothetical protein
MEVMVMRTNTFSSGTRKELNVWEKTINCSEGHGGRLNEEMAMGDEEIEDNDE